MLQAEDMYASWGLPRMTSKFWKYSIFEGQNNLSTCHGTAANLYRRDDFRMLLCAKLNMNDFYVIHHEMGHIQYYMAYKDQPPIFQVSSIFLCSSNTINNSRTEQIRRFMKA